MVGSCHGACCFIAPPDLLARLASEGDADQRDAALRTLSASASLRTQRPIVPRLMRELDVPVPQLANLQVMPQHQIVYDNQHQGRTSLPGKKVRADGDPASS